MDGTDPPFVWRRRAGVALWLALFSLVMLSSSRERPYADGSLIWQVAENIVAHGSVTVAQQWPPTLPRGRGGRIYAVAPLLQSLAQVPGALVRRAIDAVFPASGVLTWAFASHLGPAALGALTCVLFFGILRRLRFSRRTTLIATAALALGTTLWVYARYPYSEVLQATCFTGFAGALLEADRAPSRRNALWLGAWAGLVVNAKIVYAASIPGAALYLMWRHRARVRELVRFFAWAAAALAPFALMILLYNWVRWGSFLHSGYDTKGGTTDERTLWGLWGLLFSPGKSLFLYSPPLLLTLWALPRAWRRMPAVLVALAVTVGPVLLLNAGLLYWSGDYAWGPRYLVFAVPALLVPGALVIEDALAAAAGWRRRLAIAGVCATLVAGFAVQGLGNAFFWDHFIRIQREARNRWLGVPNASGTPFPDFGGGVCGACFEDMHGMQWLPSFQPIEGHLWLLRHVPLHHDWTTAEADAPWHRYTTLRLNIASTYPGARLDWWYLDYRERMRPLGVVLLALMLAGVLVPVWTLRRELARRHEA